MPTSQYPLAPKMLGFLRGHHVLLAPYLGREVLKESFIHGPQRASQREGPSLLQSEKMGRNAELAQQRSQCAPLCTPTLIPFPEWLEVHGDS